MSELRRPSQPAPRPSSSAATIGAYRDALLRDAPAEELARLAASLDPELVAWLDLFRAAQRESVRPDPVFVARLDRIIAAAPGPETAKTAPEPLAPLRLARSHSVNGRQSPITRSPARPAWPRIDHRLALQHLATAALLVVMVVAGLYAFGPLRPQPPAISLGAPDAPAQLEFLWESNGGADDPISSAYGVGVDPQGNVWVADGRNRFHIVAPDGTFLETWGTSGSRDGEFEFISTNAPVARGYGDVAFDAAGNIYVADTGNARVQKFAADRSFLMSWGSEGEGNGQFLSPSGIAVSPDGTVYVSDEGRSDVQKFDNEGRFLGTVAARGPVAGLIFNPAGVAVSGDSEVFVADYSHTQIQRFTSSGDFLGTFGKSGSDDGEFNNPNDVAVDAQGRIYVADDFNNRVQVFNADGTFLAKAGAYGNDPGELDDPLGVAVGPDGAVYVSDRNGIQAFRLIDPDGT